MINHVNHVGIAVKSIDAAMEFLSAAFGAKELVRAEVKEMGQVSAIVQLADFQYELMEATGDKGTVAKYIEKRGEGLHHMSVYSDDFDNDIENLKKLGVGIISIARSGKLCSAFTDPKTTGGILYEITNSKEAK